MIRYQSNSDVAHKLAESLRVSNYLSLAKWLTEYHDSVCRCWNMSHTKYKVLINFARPVFVSYNTLVQKHNHVFIRLLQSPFPRMFRSYMLCIRNMKKGAWHGPTMYSQCLGQLHVEMLYGAKIPILALRFWLYSAIVFRFGSKRYLKKRRCLTFDEGMCHPNSSLWTEKRTLSLPCSIRWSPFMFCPPYSLDYPNNDHRPYEPVFLHY